MTDSNATYKVICTGELVEGFNRAQVQQSFSSLFKLTPEKAAAVLSQKRVLKKDLSAEKAQAYKKKLQSIGVNAHVEPMEIETRKVEATSAGLTLALEPMETPPATVAASPASGGLALEPIESPKQTENSSALHTDASAEAPEPYISGNFRQPAATASEEDVEREWEDKLNLTAIGAGAAAAVVGAFVWKMIAVLFYYEHSFVAIGIGLLVGYAALMMGSRGELCGIVCGVLALVSILGGKYWAMDSIIEQGFSEYSQEQWSAEEKQVFNLEIKEMAVDYVDNVHSEEDLRRFLVNYGYTDAYTPDEVTREDLQYFREDVEPGLRAIANGEIDGATWVQEGVDTEMENLSTWELVKEDMGFIDLVFFFFGAGAAYKLASGRMEED